MQAKWQSAIGRCRKMWAIIIPQEDLAKSGYRLYNINTHKNKTKTLSFFQEFFGCKTQKSEGNILSKYPSFSFQIISNFEDLFYENVWTLLLVWYQFLNQFFFGGGGVQTGSKKLSPFNAKSHYHLLEPNIANLAIFYWFFLAIETLKINLIFNCFIFKFELLASKEKADRMYTHTHTHTTKMNCSHEYLFGSGAYSSIFVPCCGVLLL